MAQYELTDRQKDLLRAIAPGLKVGSVKTRWNVSFVLTGLHRPLKFLDGDSEIVWEEAMPDDIYRFEALGFLIPDVLGPTTSPGTRNYILDVQKIIDAVGSDFEISERTNGPQAINIAGDVGSGAAVGFNNSVSAENIAGQDIVDRAEESDESEEDILLPFRPRSSVRVKATMHYVGRLVFTPAESDIGDELPDD